jgi:SAM-dependent methyltransferase
MAKDHIELIRERYRGENAITRATSSEVLVRDYLSKVLDVDELRGKRILEIGAGGSQYAKLFLESGCGLYFASDLVPARLALTRMEDARYREFPGDFLEVVLPEPVDMVFATLTMMFVVPLFDRIIDKIASCLTPGGLFVSMDPNYYCPLGIFRRFTVRGSNPSRLFTPHGYAEQFRKRGFAVEKLVPFTSRFPWTTGNWFLGTNFWLRARKLSA